MYTRGYGPKFLFLAEHNSQHLNQVRLMESSAIIAMPTAPIKLKYTAAAFTECNLS